MQTTSAESIHAAHAILTRAADLHPTDATIQFNLACYEAQMGSLDRAKTHLKRATEIDAKFRLMAWKILDLEPFWLIGTSQLEQINLESFRRRANPAPGLYSTILAQFAT